MPACANRQNKPYLKLHMNDHDSLKKQASKSAYKALIKSVDEDHATCFERNNTPPERLARWRRESDLLKTKSTEEIRDMAYAGNPDALRLEVYRQHHEAKLDKHLDEKMRQAHPDEYSDDEFTIETPAETLRARSAEGCTEAEFYLALRSWEAGDGDKFITLLQSAAKRGNRNASAELSRVLESAARISPTPLKSTLLLDALYWRATAIAQASLGYRSGSLHPNDYGPFLPVPFRSALVGLSDIALSLAKLQWPSRMTPDHDDLAHMIYREDIAGLNKLLSVGVNINAVGEDGITALHIAALRGSRIAMLKTLLHHGADANKTNDNGTAPIHLAAALASPDTIDALVSAGADKNARDGHGLTPLHHAANHGRPDIVSALIKAGADRNARDNDGATPLDHANRLPTHNRIPTVESLQEVA